MTQKSCAVGMRNAKLGNHLKARRYVGAGQRSGVTVDKNGCSENAECGVRSAECGVRSAECGVRSAECGVRSLKKTN